MFDLKEGREVVGGIKGKRGPDSDGTIIEGLGELSCTQWVDGSIPRSFVSGFVSLGKTKCYKGPIIIKAPGLQTQTAAAVRRTFIFPLPSFLSRTEGRRGSESFSGLG